MIWYNTTLYSGVVTRAQCEMSAIRNDPSQCITSIITSITSITSITCITSITSIITSIISIITSITIMLLDPFATVFYVLYIY